MADRAKSERKTGQVRFLVPERQWQIDTVTDVDSRTATLSYHAQQESGRWVVSQVDLPNGQAVTYTYTNDQLAAVNHPDGTQSTFIYGSDLQTGTSTIDFFEASAEPTHRKKTVYLSDTVDSRFYTSSANLVRMIVNGDNELSYLNFEDLNSGELAVYEGSGKLKQLLNVVVPSLPGAYHYQEGWTIDVDVMSVTITGTAQSIYPNQSGPGAGGEEGAPATTTDERGVVRNWTYDADYSVTAISYSDGTSETYQYDALKRVTRQKDRLGRVTRCTYDARGNILTMEVGLTDDGAGGEIQQPEHALYQSAKGAKGATHILNHLA